MDEAYLIQLQKTLGNLQRQLGELKETRSIARNFTQILMGFNKGVLDSFLNLESYAGEGNEDSPKTDEFISHFIQLLDGTGRRISKEAGREREFAPLWDDYERHYRQQGSLKRKMSRIAKQKRGQVGLAALEGIFVDLLLPSEVATLHKGDHEYAEALFFISIYHFFSERVVPELEPQEASETIAILNSLHSDYKKAIDHFSDLEKEAATLSSANETPSFHKKLVASEETLRGLETRSISFFKQFRPLLIEIIARKSIEFDELGARIKKLEKEDIPQKEQELREASRQKEAPIKPAIKGTQAPQPDISALQRELDRYVKRYKETLQELQKMFPRIKLRIDAVHNIIGLTPEAKNRIEQSQHGRYLLSDLEKETGQAKELKARINSILSTGRGG